MSNKSRNNNSGNFLYRRSLRDSTLIKIFILPVIILLIVMNIFPLFYSLFLSFSDYSAKTNYNWGKNPEMIGGENFSNILRDKVMWQRFVTTAKFVILTVSGQMLLGFGLALLLQTKFKGKGFITTLLILPMTMSPIIVGVMWKLFYNPNWGMFNFLLGLGKIDWTTNTQYNLYACAITDIWMWTPFVMLLSIAGLSAVPKYLYEAAEIDRASWWFKFSRITLPMVFPLLLIALIFRTMEAFKIFDVIMGIAGRGATAPQVLSMYLYNVSFVTWKTSYGSAIGYIMLIVIIAITSIFIKYLNKAKT
ncbi:MAG: sugar ABC transporter permease [Actinobacteria bacterium]|nr:sugar ABC transporter permease [Actinomycetota bacterium]MCG2788546.1 sugar ABC transporter permease [Actinomycetes bacterium]